MAKDPALLFYTSDFLSGTMLLSMEQRGKYITLLCLQHQTGRLTEKHMLNICGTHDPEIWAKFKIDENGLFYNERLEFEKERRKNYSESRSKNRKGKKKDMLITSKTYDKHMETETVTINKTKKENESSPNFERFWQLYSKKVARNDALKAWKKIPESLHETILKHVPIFVAHNSEPKYRPNPATYLNGKRWEDETPTTTSRYRPFDPTRDI